ncbi:MAG: hypothetical protein AAFU71_10460 [Cyanobacteria bacterium J06632_22]
MPDVVELDGMKRFLLWALIVVPPTLIFVQSLAPADIAYIWLFGGIATVFLLCLIAALSLIPVLAAQRRFRRPATVAIALILSIMVFHWPLRLAYAFSRPAFNQIAAQVTAGETIATPQRVGWFWIEEIALPEHLFSYAEDGIVCLWTGVHPFGNTGFVQTTSDNLPFNLWTHLKLDNTWQFIAED